MASKKKSGHSGQLPLPFGKGKVRKTPVYRRASVKKAGQLQVLRREAAELRNLLRSNESNIINRNIEIRSDPDIRTGLRTIEQFLEKFNPAHGPGFDISDKQIRKVGGAIRLINVKWSHVLQDARLEISEKRDSARSKTRPELPFGEKRRGN